MKKEDQKNEVEKNSNNEEDKADEEEKIKKENLLLDKQYKNKLNELQNVCCRELNILNEKLDESKKYKFGYYELFLIRNEISVQLEIIKKKISNDEEKKLYSKMKKEFKDLNNELAKIRGESE